MTYRSFGPQSSLSHLWRPTTGSYVKLFECFTNYLRRSIWILFSQVPSGLLLWVLANYKCKVLLGKMVVKAASHPIFCLLHHLKLHYHIRMISWSKRIKQTSSQVNSLKLTLILLFHLHLNFGFLRENISPFLFSSTHATFSTHLIPSNLIISAPFGKQCKLWSHSCNVHLPPDIFFPFCAWGFQNKNFVHTSPFPHICCTSQSTDLSQITRAEQHK